MYCSLTAHTEDRLRSCGQPDAIDVEIRLLDGEGNEVPQGEPGEIVIRSPSAIAGYFNAPELNADTFTEDGWVHTRDIGQFDAEGFLFEGPSFGHDHQRRIQRLPP